MKRFAAFLLGTVFICSAFQLRQPAPQVTLSFKKEEAVKVLNDLAYVRAYIAQTNLPQQEARDLMTRLDSAGKLIAIQVIPQLQAPDTAQKSQQRKK